MSKRNSYVKQEFYNIYSHLMTEKIGSVNDSYIIIGRGFNLIAILKVLFAVLYNKQTFSELYRNSNIREKKAFIRYLALCKELKLIKCDERTEHRNYHRITEKGQSFMEFFKK